MLPRLDTPTKQIDIAALDFIRDREHGVPRFNEFRRQYGLRQLTSYDDFMDKTIPADSPAHKQQAEYMRPASRALRNACLRFVESDHRRASQ